jgi:hypothetical protein
MALRAREDLDERENGGLADAKIHVASHVIHYGSGVFEGARCYDTKKGPRSFGSTLTSRGFWRRPRSTAWTPLHAGAARNGDPRHDSCQ